MNPSWAKYARTNVGKAIPAVGLLLAACCVLSTGCNNGRQLQTDLYQRELRLQEDEIYRLEDYVDEYQQIIRGYRCELAEARQKLAERQSARSTTPLDGRPETLPEPTPALPDKPEPLDLKPANDEIMPDIEVPDPSFDLPPPSDSTTAPSGEAPKFDPDAPLDTSRHEPNERPTTQLASLNAEAGHATGELRKISAIAAAADLDAPPAPYPHAAIEKPIVPPRGVDESITLRLQPGPTTGAGPTTLTAILTEASANALDRFEGEASVMLTDPSIEGGRRRIARWDFTADEVAEAWLTAGERTLELPIALPETTPTDRDLRVWVRLTGVAGEKRLQATPLRLGGRNGRIDVASLLPRRLPTLGGPAEPGSFSVAEAEAAQPIEDWRPAGSGQPDRTIDPALLPASFESE